VDKEVDKTARYPGGTIGGTTGLKIHLFDRWQFPVAEMLTILTGNWFFFCPLDFSLETTVLWFVIMIPLPNPEQFCAIHAAEL